MSRSLLYLLLSVLLLFKIIDVTQHYDHLPSPNRVYNNVAVKLKLFVVPESKNGDVSNWKILSPAAPLFANEDNLVTLTEKNCTNFISNNQHVMVIFQSPELMVAPDCATLAMKLMGAKVAANVNFREEKALTERYGIVRYPLIYLFPGGVELGDKYYSEWDLQEIL